jgi:hypothetical protein
MKQSLHGVVPSLTASSWPPCCPCNAGTGNTVGGLAAPVLCNRGLSRQGNQPSDADPCAAVPRRQHELPVPR